jgi:hypothetical protein
LTTSATTAWISTLSDDGVRNDLAGLAADGALSYAEALQLLSDTARDGAFTAAELQDLQTVAAHLNDGVTATSYVADIFIQLVLGNPANVSWHGGATVATPLGNLHAGSSVTQLNELIGKWFLGTDLPDPTLVPDDHRAVSQPHYATASGLLYGSGGAAAIADVSQGALGDCVVCASMIEMVGNHPDLLKSMIVDNGNGTYGVRFYLNGNEVWVTVDRELPVDAYGNQIYADNGVGQDHALWVPLLEKAYAQLSETGMVDHPAVNSYENIDGNSTGVVLPAMSNINGNYYRTDASDWASKKQTLVDALAAHRDVVFETAHGAPHTYNSAGLTELVDAHAFAVLGYDEATGKFIVRNPWGDAYNHQSWTAQFELSMEQMAAEGGAVAVAASTVLPTIRAAGSNHQLQVAATVAVAPLFSVFNPDALTVSRYLFHAAGSGALDLHGAANLATAEQSAAGDVVIAADDLARLQFAAPAATGSAVLSVQALLGQQWSLAADIDWTFADTSADTIVLPKPHNAVAAGGSIALASLFQLDGRAGANVFYEVIVPADGGTLELNGARNLWRDAQPGQYEFSAADMPLVTYRAPASNGTVKLGVNVYHGNGWGVTENVRIDVGVSDVAHALQSYANGQFAAIKPVSDHGAAIVAHLDGLQTLLRGGLLDSISVHDDAPQVQAITGAQFDQYRGVYAAMTGNFSLQLTDAALADAALLSTALAGHLSTASFIGSAADAAANLDALQTLAAAGKLAGVMLTDGGSPTLAVTAAQLAADGAALHAIAGNYRVTLQDKLAAVLAASNRGANAPVQGYQVRDSAASVSAGLDALQTLAAAGKLGAITLTDSGQPFVTVNLVQLRSDGDALARLPGNCKLLVAGARAADLPPLAAAHPTATFAVSDSAAQLLGHLDTLAPLAAQGKLAGVTLTDSGTPVLNLTAAQVVDNAAVLHAIGSPYQLAVAGMSAGVARFVIQQDALRDAPTRDYPVADGGAVADGANAVVGFRNAHLGNGHNAVVLDAARDHYALRIDGSGTLEIRNVARGDADYNKSVTITGASYLLFGGAASAADGSYPDMYFIADQRNTGVAELYVAALGRLPDLPGLEYWENVLAGGASLSSIADAFIASDEFRLRYPAAATAPDHDAAGDLAFLTALYQNVLHRAPDSDGQRYWLDQLASGTSRAGVLLSFALSAEDEASTHASPGHPQGWLIDTGTGGYADPATLLSAGTVLNQGLTNGYLNTALIDPATIVDGMTTAGETLTANTLTLARGMAPQSIMLSAAIDHLVVHGDNNRLYSAGHAAITVDGAGNSVQLAGGDHLDLLDGHDTLVRNFAPGTGATLHVVQGQPALLGATVGQVAGAALNFDEHGYVIQVGSLGDGSASAAAAAINQAYTVAATAAEHATFIGQDSNGNMEVWRFGPGTGGGGPADANGNHLVDAGELVHLATLIGVDAARIGMADLT